VILGVAKLWVFCDFIDAAGENVVHAWLHSRAVSVKARMRINRIITHLEAAPSTDWGDYVKTLSGDEYSGLMELRVTVQNVQYRPLMVHGPGRGDVTILLGAIERGGQFEPRTACERAQANRLHITTPERTIDHDFS
jgi:hypothetical protein